MRRRMHHPGLASARGPAWLGAVAGEPGDVAALHHRAVPRPRGEERGGKSDHQRPARLRLDRGGGGRQLGRGGRDDVEGGRGGATGKHDAVAGRPRRLGGRLRVRVGQPDAVDSTQRTRRHSRARSHGEPACARGGGSASQQRAPHCAHPRQSHPRSLAVLPRLEGGGAQDAAVAGERAQPALRPAGEHSLELELAHKSVKAGASARREVLCAVVKRQRAAPHMTRRHPPSNAAALLRKQHVNARLDQRGGGANA